MCWVPDMHTGRAAASGFTQLFCIRSRGASATPTRGPPRTRPRRRAPPPALPKPRAQLLRCFALPPSHALAWSGGGTSLSGTHAFHAMSATHRVCVRSQHVRRAAHVCAIHETARAAGHCPGRARLARLHRGDVRDLIRIIRLANCQYYGLSVLNYILDYIVFCIVRPCCTEGLDSKP